MDLSLWNLYGSDLDLSLQNKIVWTLARGCHTNEHCTWSCDSGQNLVYSGYRCGMCVAYHTPYMYNKTVNTSRYSGFLPRSPGHCQFSSACGHMDKGCSSISSYSIYGSEHPFTYNWFNGEANNFKMELFNDIHEGSGGC